MKSNDTLKAYEDALHLAQKSLENARASLPEIKGVDKEVSSDINTMLNAFSSGNTETIERFAKSLLAKNEQRLKDFKDVNSI